jgi:DNA-directed RNA polymerase sigma subunit (sigma70/sigma32)
MRCQKCRKREATFHFTTVVHGAPVKPTTANLCQKCAEAAGLWPPDEEGVNPPIESSGKRSCSAALLFESVRRYLKQIEKTPVLSRERELELFRRIKANQPDDDAARAASEFLTANLRVVVTIAKKHLKRGRSLLDLIQEGNLGLMTALQQFDPDRDGRFPAYARRWVHDAISRAFPKPAKPSRRRRRSPPS